MHNKVLADLRTENERLRSELSEQKALVKNLTQTVNQLDADRTKLQKARDELAKNLLDVEKRALDAEEALAAAEHKLLTTASTAIASPSRANSAGPSPARAKINLDEGATVQSLHRDLEILLNELDHEREDRLLLEEALDTVRQEAEDTAHKLVTANKRVSELEKKVKQLGGRKALAAVGKEDASSTIHLDDKELEKEVEALQERVGVLKASRDKLIAALDVQAAEAERLSQENVALTESLHELRKTAAAFEAQAQEGLIQTERLKDLLEESALWNPPPAESPKHPNGQHADNTLIDKHQQNGQGNEIEPLEEHPSASSSTAHVDTKKQKELEALCQQLQGELLLQRAKKADLELQVRALCLEMTRTAAASGQIRRSVAPVLQNVESRLAATLGIKPVAT